MKKLQMATPGEILLEEFLKPYNIAMYQLARDTGMPQTRVSEIVKGRRGITLDTALRLARYFGTSVDFWINLQVRYEISTVDQDTVREIQGIRTLRTILGLTEDGSATGTDMVPRVPRGTLRPA
jgi:addiction module HigA family antidote